MVGREYGKACGSARRKLGVLRPLPSNHGLAEPIPANRVYITTGWISDLHLAQRTRRTTARPALNAASRMRVGPLLLGVALLAAGAYALEVRRQTRFGRESPAATRGPVATTGLPSCVVHCSALLATLGDTPA